MHRLRLQNKTLGTKHLYLRLQNQTLAIKIPLTKYLETVFDHNVIRMLNLIGNLRRCTFPTGGLPKKRNLLGLRKMRFTFGHFQYLLSKRFPYGLPEMVENGQPTASADTYASPQSTSSNPQIFSIKKSQIITNLIRDWGEIEDCMWCMAIVTFASVVLRLLKTWSQKTHTHTNKDILFCLGVTLFPFT